MATFRKLDSLIPEASEADEFGQHAVKLMRRVLQIGYEATIAEELANPTWDNPDWCRMIVARAGGQVPEFPEDEATTFHCFRCLDTGFVQKPSASRFDSTYQVASFCDPCAWRLWSKAQWLRKQEREGTGRRGRLDNALE